MEHWGKAEARDTASFDELLLRHQRKVLMTALHLLGNMEDAKDAAQEVFYRLHKYADRRNEARELAPWLYRVTVNVCHDLRRKRPEMQLDDDYDAPAADAGLDEQMDLSAQREMMRQALKGLPEKERTAIVLRDIEGLSTVEVAEALGSTETTVRSQISTGRAKLRDICADLLARRRK
jgi:RNA polymerase sigma-70 factor (ECF subfamily)